MEKNHNLPSYINIPEFLYQDESLDRTCLLLAGFIYSLHTSGKTIKVSNDYLSSMAKVHERKIPDNLNLLEKKGYLIRVGHGSNRRIKWIYCPNSNIIVEESNNPADNGTLPTTAGLPCRQRQVYNKDIPIDNINRENVNSVQNSNNCTQYQETYFEPKKNEETNEETNEVYFEAFWEMYPVKKNKSRTRAMWFAQNCDKDAHEILYKLDIQLKEDCQYLDGYAPNPGNYIGGFRWQDEIQKRKTKNKNKREKIDHSSTDWAISSKKRLF